jgi:N-methylhydantoinase A/oxoprolinase/acetone carboxylase beta subunit
MHACSLARRLRIPTVIVPKNAGVLSALGMLLSDVVKDYSRSVLLSGPEARPERLTRLFQPLLEAGRRDMRAEGFSVSRTRLLRSLDVRYVGQSYEISVPFGPRLREAFDEAHLKLNGYADRSRPVEVVNLRVKAAGLTEKPALRRRKRTKARAEDAVQERRTMFFEGEACRAPIYKRQLLGPGSAFQGPALVCDFECTTVLPPDFSCRVDGYLNLILEPRRSYAGRTFRRGGKR